MLLEVPVKISAGMPLLAGSGLLIVLYVSLHCHATFSNKQSAVYAKQHLVMLLAGAASNVVHPEPYRARRDALMGPEHTSSPTYRRAAVTSSPRSMPLTARQALHPRVAQLRRQESGSSQGSAASRNPLLETMENPVSSDISAPNSFLLNVQLGLEQRQWRRASR